MAIESPERKQGLMAADNYTHSQHFAPGIEFIFRSSSIVIIDIHIDNIITSQPVPAKEQTVMHAVTVVESYQNGLAVFVPDHQQYHGIAHFRTFRGFHLDLFDNMALDPLRVTLLVHQVKRNRLAPGVSVQIDKDILGLDVAVNVLLFMNVNECLCNLFCNFQGLFFDEASFARQ